jgi:hypothetical protein
LVAFTSFSKKLEVLKNKRNLAGSKVRVDEDLSIQGRRMRKNSPLPKRRKLVRPQSLPEKARFDSERKNI